MIGFSPQDLRISLKGDSLRLTIEASRSRLCLGGTDMKYLIRNLNGDTIGTVEAENLFTATNVAQAEHGPDISVELEAVLEFDHREP